jgi:hypothetical protein
MEYELPTSYRAIVYLVSSSLLGTKRSSKVSLPPLHLGHRMIKNVDSFLNQDRPGVHAHVCLLLTGIRCLRLQSLSYRPPTCNETSLLITVPETLIRRGYKLLT